MMSSIIYGDKFIVFSSSAVDAMKASMEIDTICYTHIDVHDSVITVNITSQKSNKYADEDKLFSDVEKILNKYDIAYKYKKITV